MAVMQPEELQNFSKTVVPRLVSDGSAAFQHLSRSPEDVLEDLICVCEKSYLAGNHKAAAYRALAGFLDKGSSSTPALKALCLDPSIFRRCFSIFLSKSDATPEKAVRLLLATLVKILGRQEPNVASLETNEATRKCLSLIFDHEDPSGVKLSMTALVILLDKKRVLPSDLLQFANELSSTDSQLFPSVQLLATEELWHAGQLFVTNVLEWTNLIHIAPSAGALLSTFCKLSIDLFQGASAANPPLWLAPVHRVQRDDSYAEMLERYVLPGLIEINTTQLVDELSPTLHRLRAGDVALVPETEIRFCLLIIKCGRATFRSKDSSVFNETTVNVHHSTGSPLLEMGLLKHSSCPVRLAALYLLVTAYTLPAHVPRIVLESILAHLGVFHTETDASARNEFISIIVRLFDRIYISIFRLRKDLLNREHIVAPGTSISNRFMEDARDTLENQIDFVERCLRYLAFELGPSSSYQRHIMALKVLKTIFNSGVLEQNLGVPRKLVLPEILLDLSLDAFDDVRAASIALLKHEIIKNQLQRSQNDISLASMVHQAVGRAKQRLSASGRADLADGFGRLQDLQFEMSEDPSACLELLLKSLEDGLVVAHKNLSQAVAYAPIHGDLISLRYILTRLDIGRAFAVGETQLPWAAFHKRIQNVLTGLWDIVRPILCVDSPEGRTFFEEEEDVDIGIKDTLSYSWRALKEASFLKQALVSNNAYARCSPSGFMEYEDLEVMGRLAFVQLAELRHRGAFSTVAHAFTACCIACRKSVPKSLQELPEIWYKETLACIHEKANALTRRSAGLPSMITGNLISAPLGVFKEVFEELQNIAKRPVSTTLNGAKQSLPQVHALNCLKDICTNTQLGPATEPYLSDVLTLTMDCLESDVWAIRNCGMMLFKSLFNRITSGAGSGILKQMNRHRKYAKTTFDKFPELSPLLFQLLRRSVIMDNQNDALKRELGFPAIQMIDQIGVLPRDKSEVIELLSRHFDSPLWIVREMVARALSSLTKISRSIQLIKDLLSQKTIPLNRLHSCLLCLKFGLLGMDEATTQKSEASFFHLVGFHGHLLDNKIPPFVVAVYLQCLVIMMRNYHEVKNTDVSPRHRKIDTSSPTKRDLETSLRSLEGSLTSYRSSYLDFSVMEFIAAADVAVQFVAKPGENSLSLALEKLRVHSKHEICMSAGLQLLSEMDICYELKGLEQLFDLAQELITCDSRDEAGVCLRLICAMLDKVDESSLSVNDRESMQLVGSNFSDFIDKISAKDESMATSFLVAQGALARVCVAQDPVAGPYWEKVKRWSLELHTALDERSDFSTRIGAAESLWSYRKVLTSSMEFKSMPQGTILNIVLALYKALEDDDDEVRDEAAKTASYILSSPRDVDHEHCQTYELNSVAAQSMLAREYVIKEFGDFDGAIDVEFNFVVGISVKSSWSISYAGHLDSISFSVTAKSRLAQALKQDTGVFYEERQNLFVDEVQRSNEWTGVLSAALRKRKTSEKAFRDFEKWLHDGLAALIEYASTHVDGPLGWSTKRDVFIVGSQLLLSATVLDDWARAKSIENVVVPQTMQQLLELGKQQSLNKLWIKQIEDIMGV